MGVRVSKQTELNNTRVSRLKSLISEDGDNIDTFDPGSKQLSNYRKSRGFDKTFSLKLNRLYTRATTGVNNSVAEKLMMLNKKLEEEKKLRDRYEGDGSPISKDSPRSDEEEKDQELVEAESIMDQDKFTLDPLSPRSFLKNNRAKLDIEFRTALQEMIVKVDISSNKKLYLHSELPLDEEKPSEEKSYKVENRTRFYDADEGRDETFGRNDYGQEENWERYALSKQALYDLGIAVACKKGDGLEPYNQDNYFVYLDPYTRLYCVFDGHGPFGNEVSYFGCMCLAKHLLEDPVFLIDPMQAIKDSFAKTEASLKKYVGSKRAKFDIHLSGTCATVVLQRQNKLYIGQLGDSKVLIGKKLKHKKTLTLEQLTYDHAPDVPEEKRRIYTKGGEIRKWTDGYERVFVKGRVFPCLSTTRSLGDEVGALVGISSEPEVTEYTLSEVVDKFILIGSAPVFTYLDDNEILNVLNYATPEKIRETGDILMKKAKNGWEQAENTYDDMTLICAYFMWKDHHIKQAK